MNKHFLVDLSLELQKAKTLEQQTAVLRRTLSALGFESFLYALIPSPQAGEPTDFISCTNFDVNWLNHYGELNLFENDYAAYHCMNEHEPVLWSEMFRNIDNGTLDRRFKKTADETRNWSMGNGLSIPIPHFGSSCAALSVVTNDDRGSANTDREFIEHRNELVLIANAFHASIDRSALTQKHFHISPREIEALKWLSDGYSVKQIAYKTRRSCHTINKQVHSAKLRLKSATTSQAVARAVALEII